MRYHYLEHMHFQDNHFIHLSGDARKNSIYESFGRLPEKYLSKSHFLSNWSFPISHPKLDLKLLLQMFSVSVLRNVKFARRASVVESLFSKVTGEISAVYNSIKNSSLSRELGFSKK